MIPHVFLDQTLAFKMTVKFEQGILWVMFQFNLVTLLLYPIPRGHFIQTNVGHTTASLGGHPTVKLPVPHVSIKARTYQISDTLAQKTHI